LSNLEYATGAGLNTSKLCLEDTREGILTEIKSWINNTGEDVPPVFWLSGTAGKGKSAIAHTIANWFHESGRLGACFCFDRTANRRHEMIVTTIACDLADDNLFLRREIAHVIQNDNELRHTQDIIRQWQKLIVEPIDKTSPTVTQPILIVIDALDESGAARSREQILQLLAGTSGTSSSQLTKFPSYFRILVTSRLLRDIHDTLHGLPHVLHVSMDDISSAAAEHDIQLYLSNKLAGVSADLKATDINMLAQKSDGLFEWARLASAHIKNTTIVGDPIRRLRSLVSTTFGRGVHLLDDMYKRILEEIIPEEEEEEAIPMFRSVMGQIIASSEPLPMAAFNAMRLHFPSEDDRYQVEAVMGPLGSLIIGTADPDIPIRPLHSSFYDFLTERRRSGRFSIDVSSVQRDLAIASLRIMALGLHFNICSLESSYFANYAVPDLETRVKDFIPVELSYSCRFWGVHVKATSFEPLLAREIEAFFDGERFLFWLEALTLVRALNSTARSLSSVADWFMVRSCSSFWDARSLMSVYTHRITLSICIPATMLGMPCTLFKLSGPPFYTALLIYTCPLYHLLQCSRRYSGNLPQSFLTLLGLLLVMSHSGLRRKIDTMGMPALCRLQSHQIENVSCVVHSMVQSRCGIWKLARHWVPLSEGTVMPFGVSQFHRMENSLCLVQTITRSGCGIWKLGRHWVILSEGTSHTSCLSQSRRMANTSCLRAIGQSWCGMHRLAGYYLPLS
jgi:hypothetical protein